MPPIRVVLEDDHAVVRKGIREFLEEDDDIEVVAEAGDGEKVKELILHFKPDVAVLDVNHIPARYSCHTSRHSADSWAIKRQRSKKYVICWEEISLFSHSDVRIEYNWWSKQNGEKKFLAVFCCLLRESLT